MTNLQHIKPQTYWFLWICCTIVYFSGLFVPLMDPDANEYACIAMRMYQSNDFINIISRSTSTLQEFEYLDKPHLLFWLSGLSYKIFGLSDWAYRLPSVLFNILAAYATFGLGKSLYNKETGRMAALIYLTAQAIILANHDVRTDSLLTSAVILGIWQLTEFVKTEKLINALWGGAAVALGVATKGMIAVVVAGSCLLCYLIYLRKWKFFLSWKWLIVLTSFILALSPVLYSYYLQFDTHPEKFVNGSYNQSGIKFILWTQSFERLSGTPGGTVGVASPEFSFFYHTILWAIAPWGVLLYIAVFHRIKAFWDVRFKYIPSLEFLTLGGILIVFHFMSASKFKLPHYLNILFPIMAVLIASVLEDMVNKNQWKLLNIIEKIQLISIGLIIVLGILINAWFFPIQSLGLMITAVLCLSILFFLVMRDRQESIYYKILVPVSFAALAFNLFANTNFYPNLLSYQSGYGMANLIAENQIPKDRLYTFHHMFYSFDFYTGRVNPALSDAAYEQKAQTGETFYLFVLGKDLEAFEALNLPAAIQFQTPHYPVTRLTIGFLNPATRQDKLQQSYLFKIN